ncbi:hypothetical protein [Roseivirga sp. UBA1976]|nr:hypothetical protein [Roseivirga sp. UBA1976]
MTWIEHYDAQLQYYLHIPNPQELTDEEWSVNVAKLEWIRAEEAKKS